MQYLLSLIETDDAFAARDDPDRSRPYWSAWSGYIEALEDAGIVVSAAGLEPPSLATTVRAGDGRRTVQDGPYADSKEHLGGFFVIDVPDLDAALEWAARSPAAADGAVEVRPLLPPGSRARYSG
jgi:hypothetical protein